MSNKKKKYCRCSFECKERGRLLSYSQRLRHYKKAKLVDISPSVSPTESSDDQVSESNVAGDVSMGEPDEGPEGPSPNPWDRESDEDAVSNHADETVPYDEEEENNDMDELDVIGGHVDAEVEALHHSLREFTHSWKLFEQ
jgi:hypothetical protein